MQICRAEDGERYQVNVSIHEIERYGSLEAFLQEVTGANQSEIVAYLSDGRRLTTANLRELGVPYDTSIVVYNKELLELDTDGVLARLGVVAALQPTVDVTAPVPTRLRALLDASAAHHAFVSRTLAEMQVQHEAARVAAAALDMHVLAVADTFDAFAEPAERELRRQAALLAHRIADIEIVSKIRVHPEFINPAQRVVGRVRVLGDWISPDKMRQVGDKCAEVHEDLRSRFERARSTVSSVSIIADEVRGAWQTAQLLDEADAIHGRSHDTFERLSHLSSAIDAGDAHPDSLHEIQQLDVVMRDIVASIADSKNRNTVACMSVLRRISKAQNDLIVLPGLLSSLQSDFRGKMAWQHLQRCHNMLYAYGTTIIEIVRRKEFARLFAQRAQTIAEVMARFSATERKRRQVYRSEVHGLLPFETRGLEDPVQALEMSTPAVPDASASYHLERSDVLEYMQFVDALELSYGEAGPSNPVTDAKQLLQRNVVKLDGLEGTFDKMAERSILSSSRISHSRQSSSYESVANQEATQQIEELRHARTQQDQLLVETRLTLEADITRLRSELDAANARAETLESEVTHLNTQHMHEQNARRSSDARRAELASEVERALSAAAEQMRLSDMLRRELEAAHAETDALRRDHETTLRNLETARARGEDLEAQIQRARGENDEASARAREKERQLREADRALRDHIAEADGDRAVLEQEYYSMKARLENEVHQHKEARAEVEILAADLAGLKEELAHAGHESRETRQTENILREDLKLSNSAVVDLQNQVTMLRRTMSETLDVAVAFRESHMRALQTARASVSHSKSSVGGAGDLNLGMSAADSLVGLPAILSRSASAVLPSAAIDTNNPQAALKVLREFDLEAFAEAIAKTGSTIRKWQKQCKEYRERARGKITFRNFAKGDLALFLPTRNSIAKPWAAFNVSFPHYFLKPSGPIAEQVKTRDWIVARITSITERIVNAKDPSTNPYGLSDGIKYYMLEVEDWTASMSPSSSSRRRTSSRRISAGVDPDSAGDADELSPVSNEATVMPSPPGRVYATALTRPRTGSASLAGPSSLSKLLAQSPPPLVPKPDSPSISVRNVPPSPGGGRPESRTSTASRPSSIMYGARPFPGGPVKAAPTTALTEGAGSPPSTGSVPNSLRGEEQPQGPDGVPGSGASEGLGSLLRVRTMSRAGPVGTAGSALASLASSWGVSIGRRRKPTVDDSQANSGVADTGSGTGTGRGTPTVTDVFPPQT